MNDPTRTSNVRHAVLAGLITIFAGGLLGPLYAMVTVKAGTDPWFGLHATAVCGRLCDGCKGPYETRGGGRVNGKVRGGARARLYCQPASGSLDTVKDLARHEVRNGSLWVILAGYAVVLPLVWAAAFGAMRLRARRRAPHP